MFRQVDPAMGKYPGWSPYVYTLDNPLKYVDPDGAVVETVVDVACVGWSAYDFYNEPSWKNFGWLAADVAGAAIPFLPAVGVVRHSVKVAKLLGKADDAVDIAKAVKKVDKVVDGAEAGSDAAKAGKKIGNAGIYDFQAKSGKKYVGESGNSSRSAKMTLLK